MSTAAASQVLSGQRMIVSDGRSPTMFYRKSGIFDLNGTLVYHGPCDVVVAREMQRSVLSRGMLVVIDLEDTWIRPLRSDEERERVMKLLLNEAPFLITAQSIVYVAYMASTVKAGPITVGDLKIDVIDRKTAKGRIAAALKESPLRTLTPVTRAS